MTTPPPRIRMDFLTPGGHIHAASHTVVPRVDELVRIEGQVWTVVAVRHNVPEQEVVVILGPTP